MRETATDPLALATDALRRVVYLLDRSLAPSPKVRAFRNAIDTVSRLEQSELVERVERHTITELDGIGPSTGGVINDAVAGRASTYIAKLEATSEISLGEGTTERAAIKGDCHSHSLWSDGGASIAEMARTARSLGHDYLVVTDHSPRLTIAHGLDPARLAEQLIEIAALNEQMAPFRILTGMEVDILEDGSLDLADELLADLDVVVASVHSKLAMERDAMTKRMVRAVASPHIDILGHCTGRQLMGTGRKQSQFDADYVFAACAQFDTAVEINCRPERQDPPDDLLDLALEMGCMISIDTDAHAPGQLEFIAYGCDKVAHHGIDTGRIVNTMSADELLAWVGAHRTP